MKYFTLFILLCGCAARKSEGGSQRAEVRTLQSRAQVIAPLVNTIYVGFANGTNGVTDNDWTNYWAMTALVSADLSAPADQWQAFTPAFEMRGEWLAFPVTFSTPQIFCRALYQSK